MKKLLIALLFCYLATSKECIIEYDVLYTIASIESHPKRNIGYPFIISFNNKSDFQRIKKEKILQDLDIEILDNRSIDCKSVKTCFTALNLLVKQSIENLDLGAFQFNYKYVDFKDKTHYFSLKHSYYEACNILMKLAKKYGWSMETLAKYHSYTPKVNEKYQKIIERRYNEILATK
ncbi:hypothetical protein CQA57_05755 [Helicobacter anseris]|uniref:Transglycosylase SLT domain-containing protein n=1 Tax=Helicobacter anseris TaxID=375926 RepID=A0A3D8J6X3_9HELI|nr:hypothetical protein [Helicobacter anseris]RDU73030.1 hypothetical protein CQA57_05755 [Helicobacter anseris]